MYVTKRPVRLHCLFHSDNKTNLSVYDVAGHSQKFSLIYYYGGFDDSSNRSLFDDY